MTNYAGFAKRRRDHLNHPYQGVDDNEILGNYGQVSVPAENISHFISYRRYIYGKIN